MANSPQQFQVDFTKLLKKAGNKARDVVRLSSLKLLESIDKKSPVGDPDYWASPAPAGYTGGQFRANWNYSIGSPDLTITANKDPNGGDSVRRAQETNYSIGDKIYISNSLPYAYRLEYEGWSRRAPEGMVRISAIEFKDFVKKAAASL
jgi:hypothetical protein